MGKRHFGSSSSKTAGGKLSSLGLGVACCFPLGLHFASFGVLLLETVDAAFGVDQFLTAGEEGMAVRADFNAEVALVS